MDNEQESAMQQDMPHVGVHDAQQSTHPQAGATPAQPHAPQQYCSPSTTARDDEEEYTTVDDMMESMDSIQAPTIPHMISTAMLELGFQLVCDVSYLYAS